MSELRRRPVFVAVNGGPASGKSTLAQALGERLGWLVISRDRIKTGMLVCRSLSDTGV